MITRILPGDLVHFLPRSIGDAIPDVQIVERSARKRNYQPDWLVQPEEKEHMRRLLETIQVTKPERLFLVLTASTERALLMSNDARQLLVVFVKDIHKL